MSDACPELDSGRKHVGFKTTGHVGALGPFSKPDHALAAR